MNVHITNTLNLGSLTIQFNTNCLMPVGDALKTQNDKYRRMIGAGLFQSGTIPFSELMNCFARLDARTNATER